MSINVQVSPQYQGVIEEAGAPQNSPVMTGKFEKYDTLSDRPSAATFGVGMCFVVETGTVYVSDGVRWKPSPILTSRPKFAVIGNSIAGRNRYGESTANRWSAWGVANWIYSLSLGGFLRTASTGTTWTTNPITGGANASGQNEIIDAYGNYGASGAKSTQILLRLPQIINSYLEAPDIVYLQALFENDCGNISSATSIANALKIIDCIRSKYPNVIIILSTPGQSDNYTAQGITDYNTIRNWVLSYSDVNVFVEDNSSLALGAVENGKPNAFYYSDNWNNNGTTNIHQNEAGACRRAKSFLNQLGFLFDNQFAIPYASNAEVPGNITGIVNGCFNPNPDFTRTGTSGQTLGGIQITGMNWTYATNMGNRSLQINSTGVQLNIGCTGATNATIYGCGVVADSSAGGAQSLSNVLSGTFQAHAKVKIIDPTNLGSIGSGNLAQVSNSGAGAVGYQAMLYQTTFAAGLSTELEAGDELLFSTAPFTLTTENQIDGQMLGTNMMPQTAATANGPKVEFQRMQIVRIS